MIQSTEILSRLGLRSGTCVDELPSYTTIMRDLLGFMLVEEVKSPRVVTHESELTHLYCSLGSSIRTTTFMSTNPSIREFINFITS